METRPSHPDPSLRGRRYGIPFEQVWQAALRLAGGGLSGWSLGTADDHAGEIRAETRSWPSGFRGEVEIRIRLDEDAQTRVDVASRSTTGWKLRCLNARRIRSFLGKLDRAAGADRSTLLSPSEGITTP